MSFKVKFWGVRGSIACPSAKYVAFGGNTSCVEVALGGRRVIFDCGTGARNLGHYLLRKNIRNADFLFSHSHWDHVNGFPFFAPAFRTNCSFTIRAGHLSERGISIRDILAGQMTQPFFPVPIDEMKAELRFQDFSAGESFQIGSDIDVQTCELNHPDNATGYRLSFQGNSLCYVTDTEHTPGRPDENILNLIRGADLVIYDSTYTDKEFPQRLGWGHSTWQEGVRLCRAADVKRLAIFHHDPDHEDGFMEQLEAEAQQTWPGAFVARENMRIYLRN